MGTKTSIIVGPVPRQLCLHYFDVGIKLPLHFSVSFLSFVFQLLTLLEEYLVTFDKLFRYFFLLLNHLFVKESVGFLYLLAAHLTDSGSHIGLDVGEKLATGHRI